MDNTAIMLCSFYFIFPHVKIDYTISPLYSS